MLMHNIITKTAYLPGNPPYSILPYSTGPVGPEWMLADLRLAPRLNVTEGEWSRAAAWGVGERDQH